MGNDRPAPYLDGGLFWYFAWYSAATAADADLLSGVVVDLTVEAAPASASRFLFSSGLLCNLAAPASGNGRDAGSWVVGVVPPPTSGIVGAFTAYSVAGIWIDAATAPA